MEWHLQRAYHVIKKRTEMRHNEENTTVTEETSTYTRAQAITTINPKVIKTIANTLFAALCLGLRILSTATGSGPSSTSDPADDTGSYAG